MGTNSNKNLASELGLITPKGRGGVSNSDSHSSSTKQASQNLAGTPFESLAESAPSGKSSDPYSVAHSIREKSGDHSHQGVSHVADPYSVAHSIREKSGDHSHQGVSHDADKYSIARSIREKSEDTSHNAASHGTEHNKALKLTDKELGMIGTPFSTLAVESAMARSENHHASAGVKATTLSHGNSNSASHSSHGVSENSTQSKALHLTDKELGMIGTPFSTLAVESAMARSADHNSASVSHSVSHGNSVSHSQDSAHSSGHSKALNLTDKELGMIGTPFSTLAVESAMARSADHNSSSVSHSVSHGNTVSHSAQLSAGTEHIAIAGGSGKSSHGSEDHSVNASASYAVNKTLGSNHSHSEGFGESSVSSHTKGNSYSSGYSHESNVGVSAVHSAVKGHLESHGVSSAESHFVSSSVSASLGESLSKGTAGSMGSHINFHKEGEAAVSVGHSISSHEGTSVSMSTLQSVHDHGMPSKGISAIRENLGAEVAGHSDLQVVDKVGHDVTRAIEAQGFPAKEVGQISHESGSSKLEALQALGDHARSNAQESRQVKAAEHQREM